jgi:hypothetical protein
MADAAALRLAVRRRLCMSVFMCVQTDEIRAARLLHCYAGLAEGAVGIFTTDQRRR